jgi:hypothetical protein
MSDCLASDYDAAGRATKCTNKEHKRGLGLCEAHSPHGNRPRFPPRVVPGTTQPHEEAVFFVPRCVKVGKTEREQERGQCQASLGNGERCGNICSLFPFCPYHTMTHLQLMVDIQRVSPGSFELGLFAFDSKRGDVSTVFVYGSEITSLMHFSEFKHPGARPARLGGTDRVVYPVLCGEKVSLATLNSRYGKEATAPHAFALSTPGMFLDLQWKRGVATFANTTSEKCNAVIVSHGDTVCLEAEGNIPQGGAIHVQYEDAYDFSKLPEVTFTPELPAPPISLYDFRRVVEVEEPLVEPDYPDECGGGVCAPKQTRMVDVVGALRYLNSEAFRTQHIPKLKGVEECQPWLQILSLYVSRTLGLGCVMKIDASLGHTGERLVSALRVMKEAVASADIHCGARGAKSPRLKPSLLVESRDLVLLRMLYQDEPNVYSATAFVGRKLEMPFHQDGVYGERDALLARAYVSALCQTWRWKREASWDEVPARFAYDQLVTSCGTHTVNLPMVTFGTVDTPIMVRAWNEIESMPNVYVEPITLHNFHRNVFGIVRSTVKQSVDFLLGGDLLDNTAPQLRTILSNDSLDETQSLRSIERDGVKRLVDLFHRTFRR